MINISSGYTTATSESLDPSAMEPEIKIRSVVRDIVLRSFGSQLLDIDRGVYCPPRFTPSHKRLVCVGLQIIGGEKYFRAQLYKASGGTIVCMCDELIHVSDFPLTNRLGYN